MRWLARIIAALPHYADGKKRTRYRLTMFSFAVLSVLICVGFGVAVGTKDIDRASLFLDLVKHLSYVFGSIVGGYLGLESIWPSEGRDWGGWGGGGWGGYGTRKKKEEPPVGPGEGDADEL